jgi:pimeloyl-ACP methyl ester carboxylesterase
MSAWLEQYWAILAIGLTCGLLVLLLVLLVSKYVRICLNIFMDTHPPLSMRPMDFQKLLGEEVRFRSFDGTSLRGMWLRSSNHRRGKGVIVFCHEFGSDMYSCARYARPLIEDGFDVFTFDFRAHGESSGHGKYKPLQWPSDKELEDALGACAYVEDVLLSEGREPKIGVFGISRGAGAAILAASSDPNITCLVLDGAFSTWETLVGLMKRWAKIFSRVKLVYEGHPDTFWHLLLWSMMRLAEPRLGRRFPDVRKALAGMAARPIMFVHGERDSYIRPSHTQMLYDVAPGPKYLWIVPGAKHNQSVVVEARQYRARTVSFFARYLAAEQVSESALAGEEADAEVA